MQFTDFQFHPNIAAGIAAAGFVTPTPIQAEAIPSGLAGKDLMGLAQTGTGKTAAFALPILQRLQQGASGHVRALVVAPTRELAEQIHETFVTLGKNCRSRSLTVYGGVAINPQIHQLKRGVEIVVACPGRLLDHLEQKTIDLSQVEMLVLDEADRMFDMGFLPAIRRIVKALPRSRQTLLFSATMPSEIDKLAQEILRQPVRVQIDRVAAAVTVSHALYPVAESRKTDLLLHLLDQTDTESVLIFTRTKHRAKRLGEKLTKVGYKAASLQGNLSQNRRQEALGGFRDGRYQVLVATDIAARGIDVSQVSHVINFDIPDTPEAYIHRIGRTGRAARSGDAYTLVTGEDRQMVRAIEKVLGKSIEQRTLASFDYQASVAAKGSDSAKIPRDSRPTESKSNKPPAQRKDKGAEGSAAPPNRRRRPPRRRSRGGRARASAASAGGQAK